MKVAMMRLSEFRNLIANMPVSYQASTSKKTTWGKYIGGDNSGGRALRSIFGQSEVVALARSDLRGFANDSDLTKFVIATIIWGYPQGMRGKNFPNLINHLEPLTKLLSNARAKPVTDWNAHYKQVIKGIKGIGLSTYTKFLNFLSVQVQGHPALILDQRIKNVINQGVFDELASLSRLSDTNKAQVVYPEYLACIHDLARDLDVKAEGIEFFLFEFGLVLKPLQPDQQVVPENDE